MSRDTENKSCDPSHSWKNKDKLDNGKSRHSNVEKAGKIKKQYLLLEETAVEFTL